MTTLCAHPNPDLAPAVSGQRTVIAASRRFRGMSPGELWRYRDLLGMLVWRDIQVRYRQTVLGVLWAVIQPVVAMVVLNIVFGRFMGMADKTHGLSYPLFLFAGLVPWTFFNTAVGSAAGSFVGNAPIIQKVYFPRILVPVSALGAPLVDLALSLTVLGGLMIWFEAPFSASLLLIPLLIANIVLAAAGVGLLLASITVTFRDIRHILPFAMQVWFFLTPVMTPESFISPRFRWLLYFNPVAGIVCGFRSVILGQEIDYTAWGVSLTLCLLITAVGIVVLGRSERKFADVV